MCRHFSHHQTRPLASTAARGTTRVHCNLGAGTFQASRRQTMERHRCGQPSNQFRRFSRQEQTSTSMIGTHQEISSGSRRWPASTVATCSSQVTTPATGSSDGPRPGGVILRSSSSPVSAAAYRARSGPVRERRSWVATCLIDAPHPERLRAEAFASQRPSGAPPTASSVLDDHPRNSQQRRRCWHPPATSRTPTHPIPWTRRMPQDSIPLRPKPPRGQVDDDA
ncbi:hypothetical protein WA016_01193 [Myxococcus stipitatus]